MHTNYQLTPNNYEEISRLYAARLHRVWLGNNDDTIVVETIQYRKRTAKRRHITSIRPTMVYIATTIIKISTQSILYLDKGISVNHYRHHAGNPHSIAK